MDIQATQQTALTTRQPQATAASGRSALTSDFDTFLLMLTTQMQNQDPLNPIESADFAVQLATFSGVEQQVRTNEILAEMAEARRSSDLATYAGWVGSEVRSTGSVFFDGVPLSLYPRTPPDSDAATLVVRNESGVEVARLPLAMPPGPVEWAGVAAQGAPLPRGLYEFTVEGRLAGRPSGTAEVEHFARVTEVRIEDAGPRLVLAGGAVVDPAVVSALRLPQG